jgi:probable selenate reductase molybdenum-binding subunit
MTDTRSREFDVVSHSERRVDGYSLVTGKPVFAGDLDIANTLHVRFLHSPHPHARITNIDASRAEALPGVALVLTHRNTPDRRYTTAGQGFPEPSPYDTRMFDTKVRFVGDRVAAVAAESSAIAAKALHLIDVEYQILPSVLTIDDALAKNAPLIHDEHDAENITDAIHNTVAEVFVDLGDVAQGLEESAAIVETTCETQYAQHAPLEPHVVQSYLDNDGRLVLVSSTQVPFHVRRIVARLLDLPLHRIRVIKPRVGGAFGVKQEILLEDVAALITIRTGRPALACLSRREEFFASRTRHPMRIRVKLGADRDGVLQAIDMEVISNTGAYGSHGLTVMSNAGSKTLPLYNKAPHVRFDGKAVYTNLPVGGAYRGYGATQAYFPLETALDELGEKLGIDPIEMRRRNHITAGETSPIFAAIGEGKEGVEQSIKSCELDRCIDIGAEMIGWDAKHNTHRGAGPWAHGVGMSIHMQGSGIAAVDMAAATIKMNDNGSFNLLIGATDLGTGSDTILGQIAAETLTVPLDKIIVYSSDTDLTPFDTGAYASSTTYISGNAVRKAAEQVRRQILEVAGAMLGQEPDQLAIAAGSASGTDGASVSFEDIGLRTLYATDQHQIGATASFVGDESPPPFLASFAEVAVDTDTGRVEVVDYVAVADCGTAINPQLAEGQLEGAIANGIGYALTEKMLISRHGRTRNPTFFDYKIPAATDLPRIRTALVDSYEPTGPHGAKSIAEIGINAPIPTIANAIYDAVGVRLKETPFTPERIVTALATRSQPIEQACQ